MKVIEALGWSVLVAAPKTSRDIITASLASANSTQKICIITLGAGNEIIDIYAGRAAR